MNTQNILKKIKVENLAISECGKMIIATIGNRKNNTEINVKERIVNGKVNRKNSLMREIQAQYEIFNLCFNNKEIEKVINHLYNTFDLALLLNRENTNANS